MAAFLRKIPVAASALALGLASLGNLLAAQSQTARMVCVVLAAILVILMLARAVVDPRGLQAELGQPAALAVLPTLFMAAMIIAANLKPLIGPAAFVIWIAALVAQLGVVVVFIVRHVRPENAAHAVPAWLIVFVGYVVATVTSPAFNALPLGRTLFWFGLGGYAFALPVVAYRLFWSRDLPEPLHPSVAILAAPPSLCLVAYLTAFETAQPALVYTLLALVVVSLLYAASQLPRVLAKDFHPGFAALTFPFVISATALMKSTAFVTKAGANAAPLRVGGLLASALAIALVAYVAARYAHTLLKPSVARQTD